MDNIVENNNSSSPLENLTSLSEFDWRKANWPIVTSVPRGAYLRLVENESGTNDPFWKEAFNPNNFVSPTNIDLYNPKTHFLFVLHSFQDRKGRESVFKVISTSIEMFREDSRNLLNYNYHGKPCENRSKSFYPTCDFWTDFYDRLSVADQDKYPIPDKAWRERYIREKFLRIS